MSLKRRARWCIFTICGDAFQIVVWLLFGSRMVRLVGQEVPPRDQLVTAYLRVPSDAERILAKRLGRIAKPIIYVGQHWNALLTLTKQHVPMHKSASANRQRHNTTQP